MRDLPTDVVGAISSHLSLHDTLCWLIYSLEYDAVGLAHALTYHSAYRLDHKRRYSLELAASHGCFTAINRLLGVQMSDTNAISQQLSMRRLHSFPSWVLQQALDREAPDELIQWLYHHSKYHAVSLIAAAAQQKRFALVQWMIDHTTDGRFHSVVPFDTSQRMLHWVALSPSTTDDAIYSRSYFATETHGLAAAIEHCLYGSPLPPVYPAIDLAAGYGDLELVRQLHSDHRIKWPCSTAAMDVAATNGDLEMVQWLHLNRTEGCTPKAMEGAAGNGHFLMVKWLYTMRQVTGTRASFDNAAQGGHLTILKWQSHRFAHFSCSTNALELAAARGHLAVLEWFNESCKRVEITSMMVTDVVNGGQLEVLQWLTGKLEASGRDPRDFLRPSFISVSASTEKLVMLQWIHRKYGMVPRGGLGYATGCGDRATVEWLLEVEFADERFFRADALWLMAARDHWSLLQWILANHSNLCGQCVFISSKQRLLSRRPGINNGEAIDPALRWLPSYTRLLLHSLPALCLREHRLPQWAAQHALVDILQRLSEINHPALMTKRVLKRVIHHTAVGAGLVKGIIAQHPRWVTTPLIQWAATYMFMELLDATLELATQQEGGKALGLLRTVVWSAVYHGHLEVLQWVQRRQAALNISGNVWKGAVEAARQRNQRDVERWLEKFGST